MMMRQEDFFTDPTDDHFGLPAAPKLKRRLVMDATRASIPDIRDVDLADGLVRLARNELASFGTGGGTQLDDEDMQLVLRACTSICRRINVQFPNLPFRNLATFRSYWMS